MALKYKHTVLFVDDEVSITNSLQRLFCDEGYNILTASSGREGLEVVKNAEKPISLVISDQRMPEMGGAEFLAQVKKIVPKAIRFLLTGYSDIDVVIDAVNKGEIHRYLTKPWNNDDLLLQVRHSLEQYELLIENKRLLTLTANQNKELKDLNEKLEQKVEERTKEIIAKGEELDRLNKELEANLYNTVSAFASVSDMYTPVLAGHGRRVSHIASEMAHQLDLSDKEIICIEISALLHDIGKMGFSERLLSYNESNWTPKEIEQFKKHSESGQSVFRLINHLDHIGLLIRSHHEQYDGQGYPDQLKEEEIPFGARIIAIADVYDKIVHLKVKSYLKEYLKEKQISADSMPREELLQETAIYHVKKYAFTYYDPDIVKVFLDILKSKGITSYRGREVSLGMLKAGMMLTRPVYSSRGLFLLPNSTILTENHVKRLKIIDQNDSITDSIFVLEK